MSRKPSPSIHSNYQMPTKHSNVIPHVSNWQLFLYLIIILTVFSYRNHLQHEISMKINMNQKQWMEVLEEILMTQTQTMEVQTCFNHQIWEDLVQTNLIYSIVSTLKDPNSNMHQLLDHLLKKHRISLLEPMIQMFQR